MHKYVDIIVDTLIFGDKLFNQYILYFIMCTYLGSWMGFFMHVAYPMFMPPLLGHIFHFPKSQISMLLQYLQIIIITNWKTTTIVLQTICDMNKLFWNACF